MSCDLTEHLSVPLVVYFHVYIKKCRVILPSTCLSHLLYISMFILRSVCRVILPSTCLSHLLYISMFILRSVVVSYRALVCPTCWSCCCTFGHTARCDTSLAPPASPSETWFSEIKRDDIHMALFRVRDGFISTQVSETFHKPLGEWKIGDECWDNPSCTQNSAICIFWHDFWCFAHF